MTNLIQRFVDLATGEVTADVNNAATTTDDLDIGTSDFVDSGDLFLLTTIPSQNHANTTTSTTFENASTLLRSVLQWDLIVPANATIHTALSVRFEAGADETMSGRIQNVTDGETITSVSGTSGSNTNEMTSFAAYTPTTTASPIRVRYEHKVDNGVNSSASIRPILWIGVSV